MRIWRKGKVLVVDNTGPERRYERYYIIFNGATGELRFKGVPAKPGRKRRLKEV